MTGQKKRLNLSVDAEAVKRARDQDINISDLTERILQSFVVEPGSLDKDEERKEYLRLLATMDPVLKAHAIEVPIGRAYFSPDDYPDSDTELAYVGGGRFRPKEPGNLALDESGDTYDWTLDEIEGHDTWVTFETPTRIISNFIEKVNEKKRHREVALHELRVARNVLEAVLSTDRVGPATPTQPLPKPARKTAAGRKRIGTRA
jgi:hypothetical protein